MCRWASTSARGFAPVAGCPFSSWRGLTRSSISCEEDESVGLAPLARSVMAGGLAQLLFRRSTAASVRRGKMNGILKSIGVSVGMACVTLLVLEMLLRICDFRELRDGADERALGYKHDAEIGWTPRANSTSMVTNA